MWKVSGIKIEATTGVRIIPPKNRTSKKSAFFSQNRPYLISFLEISIFNIFIGPESDHWECLSLTESLTHCCLVNLIDVKMTTQNLLRLLLLLMLMMRNVLTTVWCRFGRWSLVIKLSFCSYFEHKVSRFGQDFEVGSWSRFWRCLIKICVRTCNMT